MNHYPADSSLQPASPSSVLHIFASADPRVEQTQAVDQWIAEAGLQSVYCPNVYLGLVRAFRMQLPPVAIVVHVEDLSPSHFEFFTILSRMRRDVPVFVYGVRSPERIVRALEAGAKGLASIDTLLPLASIAKRRSTAAVEPAEPAKIEITKPILESTAPPPDQLRDEIFRAVPAKTDLSKEAEPRLDEKPIDLSEPCDEAEEQNEVANPSEVRVPWLRYAGDPVRQAPAAATKPPPERVPPAAAPENERETEYIPKPVKESSPADCIKPRLTAREYEPLLTEQELAALLGDDLGEIAMQEREMLTGEGEAQGGGR